MSSHPHRRSILQGLGATALEMTALGSVGGTAALGALSGVAHAKQAKPNVLFISIDDLNDWVGVLGGHTQAQTPNIDRLVRRGVHFTNAHCAAPACNPSRTATLTGIRPSTSGVYTNRQAWRPALPDALTLPQQFKRNGYETLGAGKIFHFGEAASWDTYWPEACERSPDLPRAKPGRRGQQIDSIAWGPSRARRDGVLSDQHVAKWASKQLKREHDKPFFLACGFFKPHLPWHVPRRYFKMYPLDKIVLPVVHDGDLDDIPTAGRRFARVDFHKHIIAQDAWAEAVQGYLAALSFADEMLGCVLDALDASPHRDNTNIVLWSDHGWSLGEKFHWKKFALWEECTRVPLVFAGPSVQRGASDRPVNLVDVYPTLVDLCGLRPVDGLDGRSLTPLLRDPSAAWEWPSLTTHGRGNHAVRSQHWRYIRYQDGSEELYDHRVDPHEWTNLADDPGAAVQKAVLADALPVHDAPRATSRDGACRKG
jgi:arylsulfatase A-like enzyme